LCNRFDSGGLKIMKLQIRCLPREITEEEVRELIVPYGEVFSVALSKEGEADRVTAIVHMDADWVVIEVVARKLDRRIWKGQRIRVFASLFFTGERP
jgi:hypothetical protein